ncbi:hypothetical protein MC7420_5491 [Coleofasciculus chthonoplastes PCC 7420]|uniref:Uncharacterized protein n=1 Tax=Coleofasciculus chthonoplastes PCC 7420 TaxID=118168 RepID=B4VP86_9CYAN|nr:hypothetical protein MC7420_5491 [Coleofasciculus chthonoplastes PCC 7420]
MIAAWYKSITARPSWQQTELDDDAFNTWKSCIRNRLRQITRRDRIDHLECIKVITRPFP